MILNQCCTENPALLIEALILLFYANFSKTTVSLILQPSTKERQLGPEALGWGSQHSQVQALPHSTFQLCLWLRWTHLQHQGKLCLGLSSHQPCSSGMCGEGEIPFPIKQYLITLFVNPGTFFFCKKC